MDHTPAGPATAPPPPSHRPVGFWIALALVIMSVAGCGFSVFVYTLFQSGSKDIAAAKIGANEFMDTLQSGDVKAAYAESAPALQASASEKDIRDILAVWGGKIGKINSYKQEGFNIQTTTAGKFVMLNYSVQGSKREGGIMLNMVPSAGKWKVQGFNVNLAPPGQDSHFHR